MSPSIPNNKFKQFLSIPLIFAALFSFYQNSYAQSFEWAKQIKHLPDTIGNTTLFTVTVDDFGNSYQTGYFYGTADFDPGPDEFLMTASSDYASYQQVFVLKLDPNGEFIWAKTFHSTVEGGVRSARPVDAVTSAAIDHGIIITGNLAGTFDFDPGVDEFALTGDPGRDIFFVKLDADGELVWAKTLESEVPDYEIANGIELDNEGNIYMSGRTRSTTDFDAGLDTVAVTGLGSQYDAFLLKYDDEANFEWVKTFRSMQNSDIYDLKFAESGNIYVGGHYEDSTDFDPEAGTDWIYAPEWGGKGFAAKFNTDGDLIWAEQLDCDVDYLALDEDENLYIFGNFEDTVDFDPGADVHELIGDVGSGYFAKYNAGFELQWANPILGEGFIIPRGIEVNFLNSFYVTGFLAVGDMDLDPSADSLIIEHAMMGSYDLFVGHYDSEGIINWGASSNIDGTDDIRDIIIDADGNVYYVGDFENTVDFDLSPGVHEMTALHAESFIMKMGLDCQARIREEEGTLICHQTNATYQWVNCADSYAIIDGETDISFTPAAAGEYAVIMEKGMCVDTSNCILFGDVGLEGGLAKHMFSVYPNPTSEQIQIVTDANATIQLFNTLGDLVLSTSIVKGANTINIQNLTVGVYYLQSITLNGEPMTSVKVVVY